MLKSLPFVSSILHFCRVNRFMPALIGAYCCRVLVCIILFLFCSDFAYPQSLHFGNVGIDEGLPSSYVYDITEDNEGYIWLTTNNGIVRFDGSEFTKLGASAGYNGRGAYRIFKSSLNELWVVTVDFRLFRINKGRCKQVMLPFDVAWVTENDRHEIIGLGRRGIVFKITGNRPYYENIVQLRMKMSNFIFYMICSVGGGKYLVSSSEGIMEVDAQRKKQRSILFNKTMHIFRSPRIFKTVDGSLYMCNTIGLYELSRDASGGYKMRKLKDTDQEDLISLCKDTLSGSLWIGTSKGLYQWEVGRAPSSPVKYVLNVNCRNVRISREGILWCTTAENGLYYAGLGSLHFTEKKGLKSEHISFLCKNAGTIYAIATDGKIALIEDQKLRENRDLSAVFKFAAIHSVGICDDEIYLVLQANKFLRIANRAVSRVNIPSGYFPLFDNNRIYYSYNGANYRSNPFRFWYQVSSNSEPSRVARRDMQGNGFIRSINDSLMIYTSKRGFFVVHVDNPDSLDYHIINTSVSSLVRTPRGSMFFSTPDRGVYIEHHNGKRTFFSTDKMLLSEHCNKVYYHNGDVWAATNSGISRLVLNEDDSIVKVVNYTGQDRLISREVNDILFDEGYVYVATNKGVSFFKDEIPSYANVAPVVLIDRIQVNNKDTTIQSAYELPFTQNNITITYNSPSFRSAKNILFKYVIVGKKARTILGTSSSKVLQLGSLAPDDYVVSIWARNIDGRWSITPARVTITILQPFWERLEFVAAAGAFVLFIILLFVIRRVNQIKERNKVKALLLDSELKALRLHMNPHFIFNTLNSLQKFILERNPIEANKYIAKFAKLMRWIMIYSDRQHLSLEEEFLFLDTYIELEQLRFDTVFRVIKNIDERLVPSQVFIPALVIQPFVENAIKYGITGIPYQGNLLLTVEKHNDYLKVIIEDNGVGREVVRVEQHVSGKEFESTGIKYTNERLLLLLESKLKIENAVTITDLLNENGLARGTRVELIIPYYNE